jgi:hypothetical protein
MPGVIELTRTGINLMTVRTPGSPPAGRFKNILSSFVFMGYIDVGMGLACCMRVRGESEYWKQCLMELGTVFLREEIDNAPIHCNFCLWGSPAIH